MGGGVGVVEGVRVVGNIVLARSQWHREHPQHTMRAGARGGSLAAELVQAGGARGGG